MKESIKQLKALLNYRCKEKGISYLLEIEKQIKNDKDLSKNKEILNLLEIIKKKQKIKELEG